MSANVVDPGAGRGSTRRHVGGVRRRIGTGSDTSTDTDTDADMDTEIDRETRHRNRRRPRDRPGDGRRHRPRQAPGPQRHGRQRVDQDRQGRRGPEAHQRAHRSHAPAATLCPAQGARAHRRRLHPPSARPVLHLRGHDGRGPGHAHGHAGTRPVARGTRTRHQHLRRRRGDSGRRSRARRPRPAGGHHRGRPAPPRRHAARSAPAQTPAPTGGEPGRPATRLPWSLGSLLGVPGLPALGGADRAHPATAAHPAPSRRVHLGPLRVGPRRRVAAGRGPQRRPRPRRRPTGAPERQEPGHRARASSPSTSW